MIDQVKKEVDQIEQEIKDFFKPLFNAQQNKTNFNFVDPSPFCVSVTEKLFRNMTLLDNRMDQILACQGEMADENVDTGDVIMQLVEYYQNVAIAIKEYTIKYNELKRKALQRSRQANPEQAFKKLSEKASTMVKKEMQAYEIVKEIQSLLERRERKMNEKK